MDHPPSRNYDREQARLLVRIRDGHAEIVRPRPTQHPLPSDGGAGQDLRTAAWVVLSLALLLVLGQGLLTVWVRSAPMVAAVDSSAGRVP
jgi:hypothetical protein